MIPELQKLASLCACALPVWLLLRGVWLLLHRNRQFKPWRELALTLFIVFMAGVMTMALEGKWAAPSDMLQSAAERLPTLDRIHLVPFHTIGPQLQALPELTAVTQLLGNTLLFAPWGFFLPLLWRRFRRPLRLAALALGLTLLIECTQLFIDRFVEVDDVLLNFLGSMLGSVAWWVIHRAIPRLDDLIL